MGTNFRIIRDKSAGGLMFILLILSIALLIAMGIGLYWKAAPVFEGRALKELLFSANWKPLKGEFGFLPFVMGTLWVTGIAVLLALPVSLLAATFLTEYAKPFVKKYVFPALDILAALPSVVYGVWGTLIIVPWISEKLAPLFVEHSTGYSALAGGIVLGVMILPLLVSLFIELFSAVPNDLREASLGLGATKWQTTQKVVLKKTIPGMIAAVVLAISRAFGETIAVLMVCGNLAQVPHSLFDPVYPIPALIANNYGEMLSLPLYEAALMFAALILFVVVLLFNVASRMVLYRIEKKAS
ncbi:phosphate ABC transporter permease subunit PstC [Bacteroidales bacterium OttesenSCG-928-B11]|nr:phosphate ABC transporter permease subunit PstC [Bacteroidales bacterium OttesenSCG-928-E04]MDL2311260.1 phosphate ABC transporter permease subunit PstC [Bacteroidales bacterium OttesenSCG-928-B11]